MKSAMGRALSRALSSVEPVSMKVLDNRFFMESAVSAVVDMARDFCLVGYPYIKKEKPLYKPRHFDNRREAAWGLAKLCRGLIIENSRRSPFLANRQSQFSGIFFFYPQLAIF